MPECHGSSEDSLAVPYEAKYNILLPYDPVIELFFIYPDEVCSHKNVYRHKANARLSTDVMRASRKFSSLSAKTQKRLR